MVEDLNNFDEIAGAFDSSAEAGLSELHAQVLRRVLGNMRKGIDALGNAWKPVEPSTLRSRKVRTSSPRALVDTGEFRADIAATSEVSTDALVAVIGTTKVFGEVHEFGAPEAGIPRRPIFGPAGRYGYKLIPDTFGSELDVRLDDATL